MANNWSVEKKIIGGFALAMLALIAMAGIALYNTTQLVESDRWVSHTHEVLAEVEATFSTVQDAETSQRGYLITNDALYLIPYNAAIASIDKHIAYLRQLTLDNPRQQDRIAALDTKITERLDMLKQVIALRKTEGF